KKYHEKRFDIIGVCGGNFGQDRLPQLAKENDMQFPAGRDEQMHNSRTWVVSRYPIIGIVDNKGKVRAMGLKTEYVEAAVVTLLIEAGKLRKATPIPGPSKVESKSAVVKSSGPTSGPSAASASAGSIPREWLE